MVGLLQWQQYISALGVELLRLCIWLVILIAVLVPLERIWPVRTQKFLRKAFGSDLVYYFLNAIAPKLLLVLPLSALAAAMHHFGPIEYYLWIAGQPFMLRAAAALVIGEVGLYWGHRWSHEIPFLWRFHSLHHSAEEMDWLVNSRAHPVDMFFTKLCGLVPMYLFGLAQPMGDQVDLVPVLITVIGTGWTFFIHANLRWRLGWIEWLVSSPAFHHWHHTNDGPELINKNYSAMLPLVDKLFGTFYLPRRWPGKYGINESVPASLSGQLLHPFSVFEHQPETRPEQPAILR